PIRVDALITQKPPPPWVPCSCSTSQPDTRPNVYTHTGPVQLFDPFRNPVPVQVVAVRHTPRPTLVCDVNGDGAVDRNDINAIFSARNSKALLGDPKDADGDGLITANDARICALK